MSEKRANDATDGRVESRTSRARSARAHLVVELLEHDVDHFLLHVRGGAEGVLGKLGEKIGGGHVPKVCGEGTGGRGRYGQIRARGGKPCILTTGTETTEGHAPLSLEPTFSRIAPRAADPDAMTFVSHDAERARRRVKPEANAMARARVVETCQLRTFSSLARRAPRRRMRLAFEALPRAPPMPAVVSARIVTPSLVVLLSSAITSVGACRSPACPARPLPVSARRRNGHVAMSTADAPLYRRDGVRIQHDPYAPGMAAKYGAPGKTDAEGFDPYADSVGAGIYSGTVRRRETDGSVVVGAQYQNHNPRPGPVYSGGGYTPVSEAIAAFAREVDAGATPDRTTLAKLLDAHPDLVNDVATGGATPLHTCGMSRANQRATALIVQRGGDIEAVDTYGYTPLDRMASNNLGIGAEALLRAGADPAPEKSEFRERAESPFAIASASEAASVLDALRATRSVRDDSRPVIALEIFSDARPDLAGRYESRDGSSRIPASFAKVCEENAWDVDDTWRRLNGGEHGAWFEKTTPDANGSYVYRNAADGKWWIDGPDGLGVYIAPGPPWAPPGASIRWTALDGGTHTPTIAAFRRTKQ